MILDKKDIIIGSVVEKKIFDFCCEKSLEIKDFIYTLFPKKEEEEKAFYYIIKAICFILSTYYSVIEDEKIRNKLIDEICINLKDSTKNMAEIINKNKGH